MKTKIYSLLYFQQLNDKYSKWIFPLHEGENIIGSDKDVDIFLYLNKQEDIIESVHCKIIIDENQSNIGIISLTDKGFVKQVDTSKEEKIILSPGKVYELKNKSIFYLTDYIKFMLIKGSLDEIYSFFLGQRLENEYQKWYQLLLNQESHFKINLNLQRKDSLISNISNNYNNNAINRSNTKEMNRMGFNNFDEVVDDNILNENNNITVSPIINDKIDKINTFLEMNNGSKEISYNKNENINENIDDKNEYINLINQKIKNEDENINNNNVNFFKENNNYINNNMTLRRGSNYENKNYKYDEKVINKDEKTLKMIKELLGENNLDIIIQNTNFTKIKKFDIFLKKSNKSKIDKGNFDIKFKNKNFFENKNNSKKN